MTQLNDQMVRLISLIKLAIQLNRVELVHTPYICVSIMIAEFPLKICDVVGGVVRSTAISKIYII